jgi:hypothetical protein
MAVMSMTTTTISQVDSPSTFDVQLTYVRSVGLGSRLCMIDMIPLVEGTSHSPRPEARGHTYASALARSQRFSSSRLPTPANRYVL